jgi:hypothetical protein
MIQPPPVAACRVERPDVVRRTLAETASIGTGVTAIRAPWGLTSDMVFERH